MVQQHEEMKDDRELLIYMRIKEPLMRNLICFGWSLWDNFYLIIKMLGNFLFSKTEILIGNSYSQRVN